MQTLTKDQKTQAVRVTYRSLADELPPKAIQNDKQHARALAVIDRLMMKQRRNQAEEDYLETWAQLVEHYEEHHFPTPDVSPVELLAHLIEASGQPRSAIAKAANIHAGTLSDIINGKRAISKDAARKLAAHFGIDAAQLL